MKSLGYITLTEAEEISGIKADTLKKRCQEGKIVGAVKQGNTWLVPRDAIVKSFDSPSIDVLLSTLTRIADAGIGTSITLFVKETIISGDLIPIKDYIREMKESVKGSHQKTVVPDEIYKMFDVVFSGVENNLAKTMEEILEKVVALHLKNVRYKEGRGLEQ